MLFPNSPTIRMTIQSKQHRIGTMGCQHFFSQSLGHRFRGSDNHVGIPAGRLELCAGDHQHLLLRGCSSVHKQSWTRVAQVLARFRGRSSAHKQSRTRVAQVYPKQPCRMVARHLGLAAGLKPPGKHTSLELAACALAGNARIGEASRPGPQGGVWNEKYPSCLVCPWLLQGAQYREAAEQVFVCPLAAELLRRYGTELFWSGHALYELRNCWRWWGVSIPQCVWL